MNNLYHEIAAAVTYCCSYFFKAKRVQVKAIICFAAYIFMSAQLLNAQSNTGANPFMNDANGRPLYLKTNYTAEGFPYYADSYCVAELTTMDGKTYRDVKVKINVLENEIYYLAKDGTEMVTTTPVRKIVLLAFTSEDGTISDVQLSSINDPINKPGSALYQVLSEGNKSLIKKITVTYKDAQTYGNAGIVRTFNRKERLFAYTSPDKFEKVEKNVSSIVNIFSDKARQVQEFIDKNSLKCKTEAEIIRVFEYYDSLVPKP